MSGYRNIHSTKEKAKLINLFNRDKIILLKALEMNNDDFILEDHTLKTENKIQNIEILHARKTSCTYKHIDYRITVKFEYESNTYQCRENFRHCKRCKMFEIADMFSEGLEDDYIHNCCKHVTELNL